LPETPLAGGELLTTISNAIVGFMRTGYGRGPMKAKTYIVDDLVVVVMRDGFTPIEQTLMDTGKAHKVIELRRDFQVAMEAKYRDTIEELTGRKVTGFLSEVSVVPDLTVEIFMLDGRPKGFEVESMDGPFPARVSESQH
jgi:uncharacterized protein YbcI